MIINDPIFPNFSERLILLKDKCSICNEEYDFIGDNIIWGNGNKYGNIMVIGKDSAKPKKEPKDELWKGSFYTKMPLTNITTGKRFRNFLKDTGFNLSDVFITNAVKCNSCVESNILKAFKSNKTIFLKLSKNCSDYLKEEIRRIRPKVIITLGDAKIPVDGLLDKNEKEEELNIKGVDINQFINQKLPFRGKFANSVRSEVYNLKHPSMLTGGKEGYIKTLKVIANHIIMGI